MNLWVKDERGGFGSSDVAIQCGCMSKISRVQSTYRRCSSDHPVDHGGSQAWRASTGNARRRSYRGSRGAQDSVRDRSAKPRTRKLVPEDRQLAPIREVQVDPDEPSLPVVFAERAFAEGTAVCLASAAVTARAKYRSYKSILRMCVVLLYVWRFPRRLLETTMGYEIEPEKTRDAYIITVEVYYYTK